MVKVGLALISTNKYDVFLTPLINSIDEFFFIGQEIDIYIFADKVYSGSHSERINIVQTKIDHYSFPYATLYRYKHFDTYKDVFKSDYLFYIDVDMKFVAPVGDEILGDIVCVQHPGFYAGGWGSTNCSRDSLAWLGAERWIYYMAGGFQGGRIDKYIQACNILNSRIADDESRGVMAEWHDETHWNWYLKCIAVNKKVLTPSYCYPETAHIPFEKKILALDKDHNAVRY